MSIRSSAHYQFLREAIERIPTISTHDHMRPESSIAGVDLFDVLFAAVTYIDMVSAGYQPVPEDGMYGFPFLDRDREAIWARVEPFLDHLHDSATFQTSLRGLRELYDFHEELDASNWRELNARIKAAQRPGWYREVLRNRGNVQAVLNDAYLTHAQTAEADRFYVCNIIRMIDWTNLTHDFRRRGLNGGPIESLSDALAGMDARLELVVREGAIGFKIPDAYWRSLEVDDVPRSVAERDFPAPDVQASAPKTVQDFLINHLCTRAGELGLPVQVHTGYQFGNGGDHLSYVEFGRNCGGDITQARAQLLAPLIRRHPATRFDIFHMSYPYSEEALLLAKYFPNAFFNFCFGDFMSPSKIVQLLHIALEFLPSNKIFAWGADCFDVESHHGSLCVTRDCIAHCLAERIEDGLLSRDRALRLMQKLMHDNAEEMYHVADWQKAHPAAEAALQPAAK